MSIHLFELGERLVRAVERASAAYVESCTRIEVAPTGDRPNLFTTVDGLVEGDSHSWLQARLLSDPSFQAALQGLDEEICDGCDGSGCETCCNIGLSVRGMAAVIRESHLTEDRLEDTLASNDRLREEIEVLKAKLAIDKAEYDSLIRPGDLVLVECYDSEGRHGMWPREVLHVSKKSARVKVSTDVSLVEYPLEKLVKYLGVEQRSDPDNYEPITKEQCDRPVQHPTQAIGFDNPRDPVGAD